VLVLSETDVASVLDMPSLIDAVEAAMVDLSSGRASVPQRVGAVVEDRGAILAAMPAYLPSRAALTTKLVSVFPENRDRPTHQALICCFDSDTGTPIAVMDGTLITAMRTAAGAAVATRLLARANSAAVAIVGTGVQAGTHVQALRCLGMNDFVVAGRDPAKVDAFAAEHSLSSAPSIEEAVEHADVVCVTTHADAPVIAREWIRPGTHVNSVGYNTQGTGELDAATIRDAFVVVESRDAAFAPPPSGAVELRGVIEPADVAEVGERPTRASDEQITVYKSVGVAVQDAAAATLVLAAARTQGIGTEVALYA
jgi:ornithine cyclodeaminase/alanine dehydrogenase-like protein (mu-crystallin family)